ncbi:MAG: glycosyltransferase [Prevotellaceae bacterium]|jgi:glycosyltransferase involved in cell wall biosynthesis|nr:glycosyltransferase [Prevotellaceae bacterium]
MNQRLNQINQIGLFTDSFPPMIDGVATVVKNYASEMQQLGISVFVFAPSCQMTDDESSNVLRYPSVSLAMREPYRIGLSLCKNNIYKQIKDNNLEIIHAHSPFFAGKIALNFAKKHKIPLIATFHSKFKDNFKQIIPSDFIVNQMIKRIISFYEQADEVWIPQAAVEETMREYGYKGKVEVVENGCDFAPPPDVNFYKKTAREKLGILPHETVYLFVGQHIYEKNIELILHSLEKIRHTDFRMFFVGTGYAEKYFRKLAIKLNINDKVKFVGLIAERTLLAQYYAAADLFLFPSLYDTSAIVMREAAAFATPSVIIRNSTVASFITDNENGFLVENSVNSFAEKLIFLKEEKEKLEQAGRAAQKNLTRSWKDITAEVTERYANLIKRNS